MSKAKEQRRSSATRSFLKGLPEEGQLQASPALGPRQRRTSRDLHGVLSRDEVASILASPDPTTPLGVRDRAILETMDSAGTHCS